MKTFFPCVFCLFSFNFFKDVKTKQKGVQCCIRASSSRNNTAETNNTHLVTPFRSQNFSRVTMHQFLLPYSLLLFYLVEMECYAHHLITRCLALIWWMYAVRLKTVTGILCHCRVFLQRKTMRYRWNYACIEGTKYPLYSNDFVISII